VTAPWARALRVIAPSDLRLVWRDGFLLFVVLALPLSCLALRWLVPAATELVAPWVALGPYHGLILGYLVCQQPVVLGYVIGILFIEERDEGTLLALRTTPLSLPVFLGYRLVAGTALSVGLIAACVGLAGLVRLSAGELLAAAALASLAVPIVALAYATYLRNKLQAVASGKLVQAWAGLPVLLFFAPAPWPWLGAVVLPMYLPMRLFASAAGGATEWWLLAPGTALLGAMTLWLLGRFRRSVST